MILWPEVKARLVAVIPALLALPASSVYDGPTPSGDNPQTWVAVGWQPSTPDDPTAGSFEQNPGPDGFSAEETGVVFLEVGSTTGDSTVPDVFALAEALTTWVQQNQTLGVLSANATAAVAVEVLEAQSTAGATQRLLLSLNYTTWV